MAKIQIQNYRQVHFSTPTEGFVLGNTGRFYSTTDGGITINLIPETNDNKPNSGIMERFSMQQSGGNSTIWGVGYSHCDILKLSTQTSTNPCLICTLEYDPVCGSDGVTYSNPCNAECAGVTWTQGPCTTGGGSTVSGCSGGTQYPTNILFPSNTWQNANCLYAGEYAKFSVTSGQTYTFSTCSSHGASANYDTELTLMNDSGTVLAYNDDYCELQSKITWTSNFNGYIRVRITQYTCVTNSDCTNMAYKKGSANLIEGDSANKLVANTGVGLSLAKGYSNTIAVNTDRFREELNLKLYPNPTPDFVNVVLDISGKDGESVFIEIFNSEGKLIRKVQDKIKNGSLTQKIDVNNIPDGFYFMSLTTSENKITERFVISK